MRHVTGILVVAILGFSSTARSQAPEAARLRLEPCQLRAVPPPVACGTFEVLENRARPEGRSLELKVVVLGATAEPREDDPLFFLAGGPGDSATTRAAGVALLYGEVRRHRDIVLVDQRGTGGSGSLAFDPAGSSPGLERYLDGFLSPETVCAARERLERFADLTQYHTSVAIQDLDEVRAAFGAERVNLAGSSYGTRVAMAYLRRYPARVRSVVLAGVSRLDDHLPLHMPASAQRSLDLLLAECEAEVACRTAFPELHSELRRLFETLGARPAKAEVLDPVDGRVTTVRIGREVAATAIQYMLYSPRFAAQLPSVIHQAAGGDLGSLAEMALFARMTTFAQVSAGMYLSVLCTEDLPAISQEEGESAAAGTFMGVSRLEKLRAACSCWPRGDLPKGYSEPVRSDVPVLIVSGALDPATPPENGTFVAGFLPHSLHLVVPHAGHEVDGLTNASCAFSLVNRFVETGTEQGLDTSCLATVARPPFPTLPAATAVVDLPADDLERFAGTWTMVGTSVDALIERRANRLLFTLPGQPSLLLAPVSPTRFKVAGPPGLYVTFELAGLEPCRVAIEQGGAEAMSFVPKPAAGT